MIAGLIRWSIGNRGLVLLLAIGLVVWGLLALRSTPVDALPDLSDVQVIIKTSYPGQAPQVVEDQVTYPLTTAMLAVPHALTVRGFSFFGDSYVYVLFEDGTDLYWARSRVLEYLNQVRGRLPAGTEPQLGPDATGVGWVYQYALVDRSGRHDLAALRSLQDWFLKFELQTVPGVAEVATIGGMVRQYEVVIDPHRLRALGLPVARVRDAIRRGNGEAGGGVIEMGEAEYMVRATGYLRGLDDLAAVPVGQRADGTPVLLADVAELRTGPAMRRGIADLDGEGEVVGGIVLLRAGGDAMGTIRAVRERLDELAAGLPDGVEIVTTYDRSALIGRAVDNLRWTIVEELAVVALVCALFLYHLRSALVVVVSLPVGVLAAFVVMDLQGINANIMSLGGIAIAIGAMVDAAIVMVETVHRRREEHPEEEHWTGVSAAATEVGPALFFSLLVVTLSFLPVFTLEAQEGRLFAPLAATKTWAMAAAAVLAVTLVPVLLGLLVRGRLRPANANPLHRGLVALYRPVLAAALRRPWLVLVLALVLLASTLWPLRQLGTEFMPPLDEGDLMYMPTTHPGIAPDKARELLQQTDRLIASVPEVARVFGKIGRADTATDPAPLTMIETVVQLKPREHWRPGLTREALRAELDAVVQAPGLTNAWVMPIKTRIDMLATGIKTPVGVKVSGPDLAVVQRIGRDLEALLADVPGTQSVYAERVAGGRYLEVDIDRLRSARHGFNVADLQEVVAGAVGGAQVTSTVEGRERYPVVLRYPRDLRGSLEQLRMLPLVAPGGAHLVLADVATVRVVDGPPVIKSEDARPNGWVFVDVADRDLGGYVAEARQRVAEGLALPPGYAISWSGQYAYMVRALERLALVGPLTLGVIVLLLYLHFRRASDVLLVLGTLPMALLGGVWLLWLLDFNLSVAVGVGFIALAGVAVELGVVMLVYLHHARQRLLGGGGPVDAAALRAALLDGATQRLRPVLMTVVATIAGLLPIMFGEGTGSEVMQRIAAPMVGGMLSALVLALLVLPVAVLLWWRRGMVGGAT